MTTYKFINKFINYLYYYYTNFWLTLYRNIEYYIAYPVAAAKTGIINEKTCNFGSVVVKCKKNLHFEV